MPSLTPAENYILDSTFKEAIAVSKVRYGLSPDQMAVVAGVHRATWYRRLSRPEDMTLRELRRLAKRFHWDAETIAHMVIV